MAISNHFLHSSSCYPIVEKAISYVTNNKLFQLAELSAFLHLTEEQLHYLFLSWAGVTPAQFFDYLTIKYTVQQLALNKMSDQIVTHHPMIHCNIVSATEYQQGTTYNIVYGACPSLFGQCFIAITALGICKLAFYDTTREYNMLFNELRIEWPHSSLVEDHARISEISEQIFNAAPQKKPFTLLLKGSQLQISVWQALLSLPRGALVSYQHVAALINRQKATRAVASAIAKNNIAYLIPCHRIIRQTGECGQYRWNSYRKQALIGWEACRS